jgi:hypothetical protein
VSKVILFVFAGRRANLELQRPFVDRLLRDHPQMEYHLWNFTRNSDDDAYVRTLHDPESRVFVFNDYWQGDNQNFECVAPRKWCDCVNCRPGPYEIPYGYYADPLGAPADVYVKMDDDIVFVDTDNFDELLRCVTEVEPRAIWSANVVNNVVCAHRDPELASVVFGDLYPKDYWAWYMLHTKPKFAETCHRWFLANWRRVLAQPRPHYRTVPGERISINTVAMSHAKIEQVSKLTSVKLGDEGAVDMLLPRVCAKFWVAHLYFGPQRRGMDGVIDELRDLYREAGAEYLKE